MAECGYKAKSVERAIAICGEYHFGNNYLCLLYSFYRELALIFHDIDLDAALKRRVLEIRM